MKRSCLVLLAHGSRNAKWSGTLDTALDPLRDEFGRERVYLAYLQMARPTLSDVVRTVAAEGARTIRILPLMISEGNHLQEDVPSEVEALVEEYPSISIEVLPPIGKHPLFQEMMRRLVRESL